MYGSYQVVFCSFCLPPWGFHSKCCLVTSLVDIFTDVFYRLNEITIFYIDISLVYFKIALPDKYNTMTKVTYNED